MRRRAGELAGIVGRLLCLLGFHDFKFIDATHGFGWAGGTAEERVASRWRIERKTVTRLFMNKHDELSGRVALVTGGSRGIGRSVCLRLAHEGVSIALNYFRDDGAAQATNRQITSTGGSCELFKADVSDPSAVASMVQAAEHSLGPIDLLVTSAGIAPIEPHNELTFESWRRVMAVNLDGTFLSVMAVKDGMIARHYGRIVCVASIAGLRPRGRLISYATSKAGVIAFVRNCAEAFAPHVRINSIAPGLIETDMTAPVGDEAKAALVDATPMKRIGQPEEIAEMVLFLLSDRSSFTTGQTFVASGGRVTVP